MPPIVKKPASIKRLIKVDGTEIFNFYSKLSENDWSIENKAKENNFPCFHHTQHIIFRFIEGNLDPKIIYSNPIWEIAKPIFLPLFDQISDHYKFSKPCYPKVMLARLQAGHVINKHVDGAGSNKLTHKIHIPLQTNSDAIMIVEDHEMHLEKGYAYEVNNLISHGVQNTGKVDRIHLIIEVFDDL